MDVFEKNMSKINALRPGRKMIILEFFKQRAIDRRSRIHVEREVSIRLGYAINKNKTNTYVSKVVKEFFAE